MKKTTFKYTVPACCDPLTFFKWVEVARFVHPDPKAGFCTDCTPEYQQRMKEEGRCENPDVYFMYDNEGWINGRVPMSKAAMREARKTGRVVME